MAEDNTVRASTELLKLPSVQDLVFSCTDGNNFAFISFKWISSVHKKVHSCTDGHNFTTVRCSMQEVYCQDSTFNPTIEAINVKVKNMRQKVTGSWKKNIPARTVPTAPIPVHTGYAIPIGRVCVAFASSDILMTENNRNPPIHSHHSRPSTDFARPRQ